VAEYKRRHRRGEALPPSASVVIRGDLLDPSVLRESAIDNHHVYGFFGVSVFVEVSGSSWRAIAATKLVGSRWVVLFTAGALSEGRP
jgi:hypothetical protein